MHRHAVQRCRCGSCGREFAVLEKLVVDGAVAMRCPHCLHESCDVIERMQVRRCPTCRVCSATGREKIVEGAGPWSR